jgi:hypothetical protein
METFDIFNLPVGMYAVRVKDSSDFYRLVTTLDKLKDGRIWVCGFSTSNVKGGFPTSIIEDPAIVKYIFDVINEETSGKNWVVVDDTPERIEAPSFGDYD